MNKEQQLRLLELNKKISSDTATEEEIQEYMSLLRENNSISEEQLKWFGKKQYRKAVLNTALLIGGFLLLGWAINDFTKR